MVLGHPISRARRVREPRPRFDAIEGDPILEWRVLRALQQETDVHPHPGMRAHARQAISMERRHAARAGLAVRIVFNLQYAMVTSGSVPLGVPAINSYLHVEGLGGLESATAFATHLSCGVRSSSGMGRNFPARPSRSSSAMFDLRRKSWIASRMHSAIDLPARAPRGSYARRPATIATTRFRSIRRPRRERSRISQNDRHACGESRSRTRSA